MVLDHCIRSVSRFILNDCQFCRPGGRFTKTINSGIFRPKSPNTSQLGTLSVCHPAGPSVDSYNAVVFAVCKYYIIKMVYSTWSNCFSHVLQFGTSIILESIHFLLYFVLSATHTVSSTAMCPCIRAIPWLHKMQNWKLVTLCWRSFLWRGNIFVMHCFAWNNHQ